MRLRRSAAAVAALPILLAPASAGPATGGPTATAGSDAVPGYTAAELRDVTRLAADLGIPLPEAIEKYRDSGAFDRVAAKTSTRHPRFFAGTSLDDDGINHLYLTTTTPAAIVTDVRGSLAPFRALVHVDSPFSLAAAPKVLREYRDAVTAATGHSPVFVGYRPSQRGAHLDVLTADAPAARRAVRALDDRQFGHRVTSVRAVTRDPAAR